MKTTPQFPFLHSHGSLSCIEMGSAGSLSCIRTGSLSTTILYIYGGTRCVPSESVTLSRPQ